MNETYASGRGGVDRRIGIELFLDRSSLNCIMIMTKLLFQCLPALSTLLIMCLPSCGTDCGYNES